MRRVRQPLLRLAALVGAVGVFLLLTSALAQFVFDDFDDFGDALWSGVQHLLDPSALEDDEGASERVIGIVQLLAGLIFIVGVLIAVLEDVISGSLRRLTETEPSVHAQGHVVIIGWNQLAPVLVARLQFAFALGGPRDVAVIVPARHRPDRLDIEEELAGLAPGLRVWVVVGDPGSPAFERASIRTASRVFVISGSTDVSQPDAATIASCLELSRYLGDAETPAVSPFIHRGINADVVVERFPASWDYVVSDRALGGLAGLAVTRPELSEMLAGPFGPEPDTMLVQAVRAPELAGRRFAELAASFTEALPIGLIVGDDDVQLPPEPQRVLAETDRIVVLAHRSGESLGMERALRRDASVVDAEGTSEPSRIAAALRVAGPTPDPRRVLAAGPSPALRALLEDLGERSPQTYAVTILHPQADELSLGELPSNVTLKELSGLASEPYDLERAIESANPDILIISADPADGAGADSKALLAALHASRLGDAALRIVADVFQTVDHGITRPADNVHVLSRALVLAKSMAILVLDPDAAAATDALLGGGEYDFDSVLYEPDDGAEITFADAYGSLIESRMVPVGIITGEASAELNPPPERRLAALRSWSSVALSLPADRRDSRPDHDRRASAESWRRDGSDPS